MAATDSYSRKSADFKGFDVSTPRLLQMLQHETLIIILANRHKILANRALKSEL